MKSLKTRIIYTLITIFAILGFAIGTTCYKEAKTNVESSTEAEYDVALPDYTAYELSTQKAEFTEDDILTYINTNVITRLPISDRPVQPGDIVVIDYSVDNATAEDEVQNDFEFIVGNQTMLDEFEIEIIGMNIGETKQFSLIYPDYVEGLAGEEAIITVTLHDIFEQTDYDAIDNADIALVCNYDSKDALWEATKEYLKYNTETTYLTNVQNEVLSYLEQNSHINTMSDNLIKDVTDKYEAYMDLLTKKETSATYREYLKASESMTDYECTRTINNEAYDIARRYCIVQQFAETENITVTDAELSEKMNAIYAEMGFDSADQMKQILGTQICKMYILQDKIIDWFVNM